MDAPSADVEAHFPLSEWDGAFHYYSQYTRTPVTTAFYSEANLRHLCGMIETGLEAMLNRKVLLMPTRDMYGDTEALLIATYDYEDVPVAVSRLNAQVYKTQIDTNYTGLRQRELFYKWFVFKDRPRTIEPPKLTNGRHRWGGLGGAMNSYSLGNPKARWMGQFEAQRDANRSIDDCNASDIARVVSGQVMFSPENMARLRPVLEF